MTTDRPQGFFKRIFHAINENIIVENLEADLYPPDSGFFRKSIGELEFKRFRPGHMVFEVEIKKSAGVPVGEEVSVQIHGVEVCRVIITDAHETKCVLETKQGDDVPPIQRDDKAEVLYDGQVFGAGTFKVDD